MKADHWFAAAQAALALLNISVLDTQMISVIKANLNYKTDLSRLKIINCKVHEYYLEKAWMRFENAGFKPLLIKGWAAAQYYPEPFNRIYNDIDFIINPEKYDKAVKFLKSFPESQAIDLHKGARHLDSLSYENLYENSRLIKCGETMIRVLRPEDHLRVLCVHWLNDGGAKKDRLRDIYYAVANRPSDFDWDRCLNTVSSTRKKWILCAIGLTRKYLELDLTDTPFENQTIEIPGWLINAVEKEWASDVVLKPLHYCLDNKRELFRQIKKRIPPNPIQATIELEGEFDDKPRALYQIGDIFFRLKPSVKRIAKSFFG